MRHFGTNGVLHSLCDLQGQSARQLSAPACQKAVLQHSMMGSRVLQLTRSEKRRRLHTIRRSTVQRS